MNAWTLAVQQLQTPITMEAYGTIEFKPKTSSKKCSTCRMLRPLDEFAVNAHMLDGRQSTCKSCVNKRTQLKKTEGHGVRIHKCQWCGKEFGASRMPRFCSASCKGFYVEANKREAKRRKSA